MYMMQAAKKLTFVFYLLMITGSMDFAVSQPSANGCSLDLNHSSLIFGSQCEGGNWGGFLLGSCCGAAFGEYLFALGQWANQTGLVYLNYTQQRDCLDSVSPFEGNLFGCGIEKLTSGAGGCSDFSVTNVSHFLGDKLKSFSEKCELVSSEGKQEQFCALCAESWEDIRSTHSTSFKSESTENDICRFAVLVTFTSGKIESKTYISSLYKCLGERNSYSSSM